MLGVLCCFLFCLVVCEFLMLVMVLGLVGSVWWLGGLFWCG